MRVTEIHCTSKLQRPQRESFWTRYGNVTKLAGAVHLLKWGMFVVINFWEISCLIDIDIDILATDTVNSNTENINT